MTWASDDFPICDGCGGLIGRSDHWQSTVPRPPRGWRHFHVDCPRTVACPHMAIGGVATASCSVCGAMQVA